jgi:hypothetical protein
MDPGSAGTGIGPDFPIQRGPGGMMANLRTVLCNLFVGSAAVASAAMLGGTGCGGIYGGGGGGPTIDVRGNIADVLPAGTDRDIVVFVYTNDNDDPQPDCENPVLPEEGTQFQWRTIEPGTTEFDVRNAKAGSITVVFLLDEEGKDADQRIDAGDPIAILNDPDCVMDDVPNKYIVYAEDVDINFGLTTPSNFPAPGRAEADDLSEAPE